MCVLVFVYLSVDCLLCVIVNFCCVVSRVPDQNGISRLYSMLEMYHSGPETSDCMCIASSALFCFFICISGI